MSTRRFNPVAWMEGMFLRPHHLQQQELFGEERLRHHLHTIDPFHWGVHELSIDEEALSDHRFVILRLDATLRDGTILRYPGNAVLESRDLNPSAERLEVHVGIRHLSATEPNVAPAGDGARDVRYLVDAHELPDLNRGGFESPVDLIHPNVRVLLSGEEHALELHESFKLAEVLATGEIKRPFALSPTYAPPLLAIQSCKPLHDEVTKIVSQIAARVRVVAGRTATIADHKLLFMRYTLARMTPVLRHLLGTGATRPFDLYTALVETAGALAASGRLEPVELPGYDHEDLYRCFRTLLDFIDDELNKVVPDRFKELKLPFDPAKRFYATSALNVELVSPKNLYYLGVKASGDSQELSDLVVKHGKAGSRSGVPTLETLKLQGLRLERLPAAPTEIAGPPGFQYYKVEPHGPQWAKVREEFTFAVSLSKLEDADVRLYVVTHEG